MNALLRASIQSGPEPRRPAGLTDELLKELNDDQIQWYAMCLGLVKPIITKDEARELLRIHKEIRAKGHRWGQLNKLQKHELIECYEADLQRIRESELEEDATKGV